jgi:putative transposase
MKYNPDIHHRRSIRLKDYDYSSGGAYFVTICTFDRGCYFEQFQELKNIVESQWCRIPHRFPGVELDEYVIMPNHFHGIIMIHRRGTPCGYPDFEPSGKGKQPSLGGIVGSFKSLCVNSWLKVIKEENINARGRFWQENYYEHVIRDEKEMDRIRQYIANNPLQWAFDRENRLQDKQQPKPEKWMV